MACASGPGLLAGLEDKTRKSNPKEQPLPGVRVERGQASGRIPWRPGGRDCWLRILGWPGCAWPQPPALGWASDRGGHPRLRTGLGSTLRERPRAGEGVRCLRAWRSRALRSSASRQLQAATALALARRRGLRGEGLGRAGSGVSGEERPGPPPPAPRRAPTAASSGDDQPPAAITPNRRSVWWEKGRCACRSLAGPLAIRWQWSWPLRLPVALTQRGGAGAPLRYPFLVFSEELALDALGEKAEPVPRADPFATTVKHFRVISLDLLQLLQHLDLQCQGQPLRRDDLRVGAAQVGHRLPGLLQQLGRLPP
jgi:hypothetical protein